MSFSVIVLAAGRGTRMHSLKPKVLQLLAGIPLIHHILGTVAKLNPQQTIVVCGYKGKAVQQACSSFVVDWVWQKSQLGTGDAVREALSSLKDVQRVLILNGDVPLVSLSSLKALLDNTPANEVGCITTTLDNPSGLGRIIRDKQGKVLQIVEEQDASCEQRAIKEINAGLYVVPREFLVTAIPSLKPNNNQQELYITDLIKAAVSCKLGVSIEQCSNSWQVLGVNTQHELANLERSYQYQQALSLLSKGVKIYDPRRLDIRGTVEVGTDVSIDINVIFEGNVSIASGVVIGPNVIIKDSFIGSGTEIQANSIIDSATIASNCSIGPFARIRPGTCLQASAKVGNFVEIKNASLGANTKVNHLSYIGDAQIGKSVNIGAGTITCNFDGVNKHQTTIEDNAFIGSNTEIVAPIIIGQGATIAAGTTLVKDAPSKSLTLTKKKLQSFDDWQRPCKEKS